MHKDTLQIIVQHIREDTHKPQFYSILSYIKVYIVEIMLIKIEYNVMPILLKDVDIIPFKLS